MKPLKVYKPATLYTVALLIAANLNRKAKVLPTLDNSERSGNKAKVRKGSK